MKKYCMLPFEPTRSAASPGYIRSLWVDASLQSMIESDRHHIGLI